MQRSQCHWNNNQKFYKQANGIHSHGSLLFTIDTYVVHYTHTHTGHLILELYSSAGFSHNVFFYVILCFLRWIIHATVLLRE